MGCTANTTGCVDQYNCADGSCPDFLIKRNDTKPEFKVKVEDCDGPIDLTDLVLEASMWANGKLKVAMSSTDSYLSLADNIGFNQVMIGDVIVVNRPRQNEHMLVTAFDEDNFYIQVQRGYHGTTAQNWKKGQSLKIIKFMNVPSTTLMNLEDVINIDGTTTPDVLNESFLVYNWQATDTCLPGCYFLEFKLMKMAAQVSISTMSVTPSFSNPSMVDYHCGLPVNVEWIRRFPADSEGYKIKIYDSPTSEM
jgi:hypothetical protein